MFDLHIMFTSYHLSLWLVSRKSTMTRKSCKKQPPIPPVPDLKLLVLQNIIDAPAVLEQLLHGLIVNIVVNQSFENGQESICTGWPCCTRGKSFAAFFVREIAQDAPAWLQGIRDFSDHIARTSDFYRLNCESISCQRWSRSWRLNNANFTKE